MANPIGKTDKQTPGVYRRRIGDALVTTINDGFLDISFEILRGAGIEDLKGLMRGAFRDGPPRLTVNAFVIETDRNTILVDSGGGSTTSSTSRRSGHSPTALPGSPPIRSIRTPPRWS